MTERDYSEMISRELGGIHQRRTPDGSYVDVLTETHAYEVEFAPKWQEAVGQALFYSVVTDRKPGIILLCTGSRHHTVYYLRCKLASQVSQIDLVYRRVPE